MNTYQCIDCELHYCVECEPGEDSCDHCHTGPRCTDCAADHVYAHGGPEDDTSEDTHSYVRNAGSCVGGEGE